MITGHPVGKSVRCELFGTLAMDAGALKAHAYSINRKDTLNRNNLLLHGVYMNRDFRDAEKMRISINCFHLGHIDVHWLWAFSTGDSATV